MLVIQIMDWKVQVKLDVLVGIGRRPRNRGVVMNPVDHPMGGGEGRASGGHPRSRKGLYAKGLKTRAPKKQSSKYIIERRKK